MNGKLERLYKALSAKYELPDYETFVNDLKDPGKLKRFHGILLRDNYDVPEDVEEFSIGLGLKKKYSYLDWIPSKEDFTNASKEFAKESLAEEAERGQLSDGAQTAIQEGFEISENLKLPDLTLKTPDASSYPNLTFMDTLSQMMRRSVKEEIFKEKAKERIAEIDEQIKILSEAPRISSKEALEMMMKKNPVLPNSEERRVLERERDILRMAISSPTKAEAFMTNIFRNSLIGMVSRILDKEFYMAEDEWLSRYDSNTLEDIGSMVLGMVLLDAPFFSGTFKLGAKGAENLYKLAVKKSVEESVDKLVKAGIGRELAEKMVQKGTDKVSTALMRIGGAGTSIGSYDFVANALSQWGNPEYDFKDIKWGEAFKHGMKGTILGTTVGGLGAGFARLSQISRGIPSALGRTVARPLISAGGLAAESAVFSAGSAWFEGRPVTKEDFLHTLGFLTGLRTIHFGEALIKRPAKVLSNLYRSPKYDPEKAGKGVYAVDFELWEIRELGEKDYNSLIDSYSKDNEKLGQLLQNDKIPAMIKCKILWAARGVGMENVSLKANRIEREGEYLNIYNEKDVLIDRRKYANEEEAQQQEIELGLLIKDSKLSAKAASNLIDRVKVYEELRKKGIKAEDIINARRKNPMERTPEEHKIIAEFEDIINRSQKTIEKPKEEISEKEEVAEEVGPEKELTVEEKEKSIEKEYELKPAKDEIKSEEIQERVIPESEEGRVDISRGVIEGEGRVEGKDIKEVTGRELAEQELKAKETAFEVSEKLKEQRRIEDKKVFKEQKQQLIDDLYKAEDILLGENREEARKFEEEQLKKEWGGKAKDKQEYIDQAMYEFYQYKSPADLPPELVKQLRDLGIKIVGDKFVIDVYRDGTVEVGDIRAALNIILKRFPQEPPAPKGEDISGPRKPSEKKLIEIAEGLSLEEAENRVKIAEENLREALKEGRTKVVKGKEVPIPVNKGLVKVLREHLEEARKVLEYAKKIDYKALARKKQIEADAEFNDFYEKFKNEGLYYYYSKDEIYDIIEKAGRPKKLTLESVMPLIIKEGLAMQGKTVEQRVQEIESEIAELNNRLIEKSGKKDSAGLRYPQKKAREKERIAINNQRILLERELKLLERELRYIKKYKSKEIKEIKEQPESEEKLSYFEVAKKAFKSPEKEEIIQLIKKDLLPEYYYNKIDNIYLLAIREYEELDPQTGENVKKKNIYYQRKEGDKWETINDVWKGNRLLNSIVIDRRYSRNLLLMPDETDFHKAQYKFGEVLKEKLENETIEEYKREENILKTKLKNIKEEAENEYIRELKKAKLYDLASKDKAPIEEINKLRNKIKEKWEDKLERAKKAIEDFQDEKDEYIERKMREKIALIKSEEKQKVEGKEEFPKSEKKEPSIEAFAKPEIKKTAKQHKEDIERQLRDEFSIKGVPQEQIDGALALLNARANAWASEQEGRTPEQYYQRIAGVKGGEFTDVSTPKLYQLPDGRQVLGMAMPEVTNGFYSPIEKRLIEFKQEKASVNKWKEIIGKGDEAVFTGVLDWLNNMKPDRILTKAEIYQFMKDNRIEVVEVEKREDVFVPHPELTEKEKIRLAELDKLNQQYPNGAMDDVEPGSFNEYLYLLNTRDKSTPEELIRLQREAERKAQTAQRQGDRELADKLWNESNLLTMRLEALELANERRAGQRINETKFSVHQLPGKKENYKEVLVTMPVKESLREEFQSSHFDEPNILVHLRMNTRIDSDGKKVLFLEEIQSDWGQTGKKFGFKTSEGKSGVPVAPFVTETNAWVKLGLKVALKEAVKQKADRIAWTTGEQQNERYSLSKKIDTLRWIREENNTWSLMGDKNGSKEFERNIPDNELEDWVGKDIAQRMRAETPKSGTGIFQGEQLRIGGKGMIGFYGSPKESKLGIVGNIAKGLFKQEPKIIKIDPKLQQHSIVITPQLKAEVEKGLPLFQEGKDKPKGAVEILEDGRVIIHALNSPDFSTMVHEIVHVFEKDLTDKELSSLESWSGYKKGTKEFSESFARAGERYLRDGKSPTEKLRPIFEKFKQWLSDIYKSLKDSPISKNLSPEVKAIFDRLLTERTLRATGKKQSGESLIEAFAKSKSEKLNEKKENNKKLKNEAKIPEGENESLIFDEPLQLSARENKEFKNSDLNTGMSLRNISRRFIHALRGTEGGTVRNRFIRLFNKKARALFNVETGVIRVSSLRDLDALCHEWGHKLDIEVFDISGIFETNRRDEKPNKYSEIAEANKIEGIKYRSKTYKSIDEIKNQIKAGKIPEKKGNEIINEIEEQLRERDKRLNALREKLGDDVVAGVLHRETFKMELKQLLEDVGYSVKERSTKEGIAELFRNYILDEPQVIRSCPNLYEWFKKFLETVPEVRDAINKLKEEVDWKRKQDVRDQVVQEMMRETETDETSWLHTIVKVGNDLIFSMANQLRGSELVRKEWEFARGDIEQLAYRDPFIQAKLMLGLEGKMNQMLLKRPFFIKRNDIEFVDDVKPLIGEILKPLILGKPRDMDNYAAYLLCLDSIESHTRGKSEQAYFPLEQAQQAKKLFEEQYGVKKLMEHSADIQKWNHYILDYGKKAGIFSPETVDYWKRIHQHYVPLKRIAEIQGLKGMSYTVTSNDIRPDVGKVVHARKGSMKQIKYVYESLIDNAYHIVKASEENRVNMARIDALKEIDEFNKEIGVKDVIVDKLNIKDFESYYDERSETIRYKPRKNLAHKYQLQRRKPNIVVVKEAGKDVLYDVKPEYYQLLWFQENRMFEAAKGLIKWGSLPGRWLQAGAVIFDPTFPVRNIFRDQISAWFYSKYGYYPPLHLIQGFFSAIMKDEYYEKWLASGGDQAFLISADMLLSGDFVKRQIGAVLERKINVYARNPLKILQDFSKFSELGTRLGAFRNAYKKTNNVHLAAVEARDISADYGIHGEAIKALLPFFPFLNARIQHTRMSIEAIKRDPAEFIIKGLAVFFPAILNWYLNNQDEESTRLYQGLPLWKRIGMFNIRIPGTEHFLSIPKGFFGMMWGGVVESVLDKALEDDPTTLRKILPEGFKEISPLANIQELAPFPIRPVLEDITNTVAYTGMPLIPEYMKTLEKPEQYFNSTTEIAKKIGEYLNWSPARIEHYIRSYFGGAGIGAVRITDNLLQAMGLVEKKAEDTFNRLSKLPFTKAFISESPVGVRSQYIIDFYETLDKMERVAYTVNEMLERGDVDRKERFLSNKENERMYTYYNSNSSAINAFRTTIKFVRDYSIAVMKDDLLTSKQRRDEINRLNNIIQDVAIKFKKSWENYEWFDYGKAMDELIESNKEWREAFKEAKETEKNIYNWYWQNLKSKEPEIFKLLKDYDGLKNISQRREIIDSNTGKKINLDIWDVRRFNEEVVDKYARNIKIMIGVEAKRFEKLSEIINEDTGESELNRLLNLAWERAINEVKTTFEPTDKLIKK